MTVPSLTPDELQSRYELLCKASQPSSQMDARLQAELSDLESLIKLDLVELTRKGCPDNITGILKAFDNELTRFRAFCEFPELASKSIIGIGGGFSAGKSSFINRLIGQKCLVVEIDPTTSMPAYVLKGTEETIKAINLHNCAISLTKEQFVSLTHEEKDKYGSQVGILLQSAFITLPDFQWDNLAILDTPGYSKPDESSWNERTDENLARSQLNTADYIVWVVPADNGTISEEDIQFLSSLDNSIPKLIVLSKADKKDPADIPQIVNLIKSTLERRGIRVLGVVPYSRQKRANYPLDSICRHFDHWNQDSNAIQFAQNFKKQFLAYQSFVEEEQRQAHRRVHKLNRILTMADDDDVNDEASDLLTRVKQELDALTNQQEELLQLNHLFFSKLKRVGNLAGVPLPEPSALDLMDLREINLLGMLRDLRQKRGIDDPAVEAFAFVRDGKPNQGMIERILRQEQPVKVDIEINNGQKSLLNLSSLLRQPVDAVDMFSSYGSKGESMHLNLPSLLRYPNINLKVKQLIDLIE